MLKKTLGIARNPSALVAALIFFLAGVIAWPQAQPPSMYDPKLISYNATPFGTCQVDQVALNVTNGAFYSCNPLTHTWVGTQVAALPMSITQGSFTHTLTGATTAPRTWTLQDTSDTFVFRSTTDTLTNKTLTSPTITNPSTTGTDSGTETLTNKTLTSPFTIGTDSGTETLQNKTLTGASNGNSVTLLCSSGPAAAITGNSSAQTFYSCTIPANAVANLKALRVTAVWSHSTGSAAVTYGLTLNRVTCWPSNNTATTAGSISQSALIIETGSTTGNALTPQGFFPLTANTLSGLAWTSGQTLAATFSVANTDQITPLFFLVELIQ